MFGPQFADRATHATAFAHGLFGMNRAGATVGGSTIPIIGGFICLHRIATLRGRLRSAEEST